MVAMQPDAVTPAANAKVEAKESIPGKLKAKVMPRFRSSKTLVFLALSTKIQGVPMT